MDTNNTNIKMDTNNTNIKMNKDGYEPRKR